MDVAAMCCKDQAEELRGEALDDGHSPSLSDRLHGRDVHILEGLGLCSVFCVFCTRPFHLPFVRRAAGVPSLIVLRHELVEILFQARVHPTHQV